MMRLLDRRACSAMVAWAGVAAALGTSSAALADEGPPESTTIRLPKIPGICIAPAYAADELLRAEGFTDIRYVPVEAGGQNADMVARGELDFTVNFVSNLLPPLDAGKAITVLAGVHPGCFELFANDTIQGIRGLGGKRLGVQGVGSSQHLFLA